MLVEFWELDLSNHLSEADRIPYPLDCDAIISTRNVPIQ